MLKSRLKPREAKSFILDILRHGNIVYARPHAIQRMEERDISTLDCENILRGGVVQEPELENGVWRYQVRTRRMTVVAHFYRKARF